jgi:hypothetical protein
VRFNQQSPSNFTHSEDLACREVETPEVLKVGVNHGSPKSEDMCQ